MRPRMAGYEDLDRLVWELFMIADTKILQSVVG